MGKGDERRRSVPNGALHRLRKTLGTIVHGRTDKTDRQLADWLGHKDPALRVRVYTGQMDDGLGKADFLDEVIPVEKWATQHPQTAANGSAVKRREPAFRCGNGEQPQVAADLEPKS